MDEDKLKNLFEDFKPELSSSRLFINKLDRKLNSVEMIVKHNAEVKARNRKAAVLAVTVGFVLGFLISLSLPYLRNLVNTWQLTLPGDSIYNIFAANFATFFWCIVGITSILFSLNAYELSRSLLSSKQ